MLVEWDPIGGGDGLVPNDVYDGYIPVIYRMMLQHVGVDAIASHLNQIESERMGIKAAPERNLRVAKARVALVE